MKLISFTLFLFLLSPAFAGYTNSQPQMSKVVQSIQMDLDGDYYVDTAYLAKPEKQAQEDLDLWIKLSTDNQYFKIEAAALDINGGMAGLATTLSLNSSGSLELNSINDSIGRGRWQETITFAYRNGSIVLAGYTRNYHDTLDMTYLNCDVNVLTGKGLVQTEKGNASFEFGNEDKIDADSATSAYLSEVYFNNFCVDSTFDMGMGDL